MPDLRLAWTSQILWDWANWTVLSVQCRSWGNLALILDLCISVHFSTPARSETLFPFALKWFICANLYLLPPFLSLWERQSFPRSVSKLWGALAKCHPEENLSPSWEPAKEQRVLPPSLAQQMAINVPILYMGTFQPQQAEISVGSFEVKAHFLWKTICLTAQREIQPAK